MMLWRQNMQHALSTFILHYYKLYKIHILSCAIETLDALVLTVVGRNGLISLWLVTCNSHIGIIEAFLCDHQKIQKGLRAFRGLNLYRME